MSRFLLCAIVLGCIANSTFAEDWPSFRGPTGMGLTTETDLPLTWSKDGTNVLWKSPLPNVEAMAKLDWPRGAMLWPDILRGS